MNITLAFQDLDDLIVQHTQAPVTTMLRNKLHPLRDQIEAYITTKESESETLTALTQQYAQLQAEHSKLKEKKPKTPMRIINRNPPPAGPQNIL